MPPWPDYRLLDFGAGRKLERFAGLVLDRPCPAAEGEKKAAPKAWGEAVARYDGARATDGVWKPAAKKWANEAACRVPVGDGQFTLEVAPSDAGQVGLFPEQLPNWRWIAERSRRARSAGLAPSPSPSPLGGGGSALRVLNLFAYTGGSTLAAAAAQATVTHVDASKPSVDRARSNAEQSGLAEAPIRWIVEDAVKYCRRELKRESFYDAVILDPPSYGHGPKGEEWRLERDLPVLLELCRDLTKGAPAFFLATCHTPGVGPAELSAYLSDSFFGHCGQPPASGRLWLTTEDGRKLDSGVYARWPR